MDCVEADELSLSHRKIFEKYDTNKSPTYDIAREHSQSDSSDHEEANMCVTPMEIGECVTCGFALVSYVFLYRTHA